MLRHSLWLKFNPCTAMLTHLNRLNIWVIFFLHKHTRTHTYIQNISVLWSNSTKRGSTFAKFIIWPLAIPYSLVFHVPFTPPSPSPSPSSSPLLFSQLTPLLLLPANFLMHKMKIVTQPSNPPHMKLCRSKDSEKLKMKTKLKINTTFTIITPGNVALGRSAIYLLIHRTVTNLSITTLFDWKVFNQNVFNFAFVLRRLIASFFLRPSRGVWTFNTFLMITFTAICSRIKQVPQLKCR